jgi:hypothetical protein
MSPNVLSALEYNLKIEIQDNQKIISVPSLKLSDSEWANIQIDNCKYSAKVTKQQDLNLLVEGVLFCMYTQGESYFETPDIVLQPEGGEASIEMGEDKSTWKYSVLVSSINK